MFNKFSIRSKIISIVSLLLLGLVALGLLAGQSMRVLHANAHNISAHWLPSVKVLGELHAGTITYRATLRAHLLAETVDEKAAVESMRAHYPEAKRIGRAVEGSSVRRR